jgi:hypothetical protein
VRSPRFSEFWMSICVANRRTALSRIATFFSVGEDLSNRRTPRVVKGVALGSEGSLVSVE